MHKRWPDTPYEELTRQHEPPCVTGGNHAPPPKADNPNQGPVPFLTLRGHWLTQVGLGVGANVRIEAFATGVTLRNIDPPGPLPRNIPTPLEREVHYTEVQPHTHHPHKPWSEA
jgi:hypothetical protein